MTTDRKPGSAKGQLQIAADFDASLPQAEDPKEWALAAEEQRPSRDLVLRKPVKLVIVVSKGKQNEEGRILTDSPISDVIRFLQLLGVERWELDAKGSPRLFCNEPDIYVAIGPVSSREGADFLKGIRRLPKE